MIGSQLEDLCAQARNEILLVSPFIKVSTLTRLINLIRDDVNVNCVTRWRPEEIAKGVSDLEVWHIFRNRQNSSLRLNAVLHAKYYRADDWCLVGSANLTDKALGWSSQPNLELLIPLQSGLPALTRFEEQLLMEAVEVDESLYQKTLEAVQVVGQSTGILLVSNEIEHGIAVGENYIPSLEPSYNWLPHLRNPSDLYIAYCGRVDQLSTSAREAAITDLMNLQITPGLSKEAFEACVGVILLQKPVINKIDTMVVTPQRFGAIRGIISSVVPGYEKKKDAERAWQTLMRWLIYFLPRRYGLSVPHHSEVFYRLCSKEENRN